MTHVLMTQVIPGGGLKETIASRLKFEIRSRVAPPLCEGRVGRRATLPPIFHFADFKFGVGLSLL